MNTHFDPDNVPVIGSIIVSRRWWLFPACLLVILGLVGWATYNESQAQRERAMEYRSAQR